MTLKSYLKSSVLPLENPNFPQENRYAVFGWYWEPSERVTYLTNGLGLRGNIVDIWSTPQIEAVCWLLGIDEFPLPSEFVPEVHELFCNIAVLYMIFSTKVPKLSEIQDALDEVRKLRRELRVALRKIRNANPQLKALALDFSDAHVKLAKAHHSVVQLDDFFSGVIEWPQKATEQITQDAVGQDGRTRNWASEVIALKCADIYFTAFGSTPNTKDGHPSFRTFLEKFCVGFPSAEKADKRKLARIIERGGYPGELLGLRGQVRELP